MKNLITKKTSLKNLSLNILLNSYASLKNSLSTLLMLLSSDWDFLANNPQLLFIKNHVKELHLHIFHSVNKKVILIQLESSTNNYLKLTQSIWKQESQDFFKKNGKSNEGFFDAMFKFYTAAKKEKSKFMIELLIVKNTATKKDINEIKNNMFNSAITIPLNKNGIYTHERLLPHYGLNCIDMQLLENIGYGSKSFINLHLVNFLSSIASNVLDIKLSEEKIPSVKKNTAKHTNKQDKKLSKVVKQLSGKKNKTLK
jgi:hypothetical protein